MGFLCLKLCCLVGPVCHLSKCKAKNAIFSRQSRNLSFSVYSRSVPPFQYFANSQYQIFRDFKTKIELILEGNFDGVRILYPVVKCSIFWRFITIARSNAIQHHQYFTFLLTHYFPVHFCTSMIFVKKFNFNQTLVLMKFLLLLRFSFFFLFFSFGYLLYGKFFLLVVFVQIEFRLALKQKRGKIRKIRFCL